MNDLYQNKGEEVQTSFSFSSDVLAKALQRIYSQKMDVEGEIEPNLFHEICRILDDAAADGVAQSEVKQVDDFLQQLQTNNEVFAAFKVHRMQRDMVRLLFDSNGTLKPFEKWVQEVTPIASHQVRHWLQTEYDTAVLRAHQAADWQQFLRERDVLPNLKWMPSTSLHPGADHRPFWNTIRPIDDPFWSKHRPGDRWNCKCDLTATDEEPTQLPDYDNNSKAQPGLDNNPGTDGILFSDSHPYFPNDCKHCAFYKPDFKNRLIHIFSNRAKDCYDCPYLKGCLPGEKKVKRQRDEQQKAAAHIKQFKATLDPFNGATITGNEFMTGALTLLRRSMQDVYEHNREDIRLMKWLQKFDLGTIKGWEYQGWAENRPYSPEHPKFDPKNPNRKKHPETEYFTYYSLKIGRKTYWANVKVHKDYGEVLYTIEEKKPDDLLPGIK